MTEFFRDYTYYSNDFVVYTDNSPLTYGLSTAIKLSATPGGGGGGHLNVT